VTILLIWAIGLIFSLPFWIFAVYDPAFNPTDLVNNTSNLITICHLDANSSTARACTTWFIVILIFLPFFVLIYIYTRIIVELARHRAVRLLTNAKTQQQLQPSAQCDDESNSLNGGLSLSNDNQQSNSFLAYKRFEQKRLNTVIICVVTVAFFACQFPVRIIQLIHMYVRVQNEETMPHLAWLWLWKLSKLLFFLNFTANPVSEHFFLSLFSSLLFSLIRLSTIFSRRSSDVRAVDCCKSIVR
jgi:7 transmembrane receptor (rhodopsin family)